MREFASEIYAAVLSGKLRQPFNAATVKVLVGLIEPTTRSWESIP